MPEAVQLTQERKRDKDKHHDGYPYASRESPRRRVCVGRGEVMIESRNHIRHKGFDDNKVTVRRRAQCDVLSTTDILL